MDEIQKVSETQYKVTITPPVEQVIVIKDLPTVNEEIRALTETVNQMTANLQEKKDELAKKKLERDEAISKGVKMEEVVEE